MFIAWVNTFRHMLGYVNCRTTSSERGFRTQTNHSVTPERRSDMEALEAAQAAMAIVQSTGDASQGRQAFREKRKAVFKRR